MSAIARALDTEGVERLGDRLGITARHLRRLFLQHLGATPIDVALTRRVHSAKKLLDQTSRALHQVALASGFGSVRRFNSQMRRTYTRTPTELRRLARQRLAAEPECYRFRLAYRPPYDWNAVLAFLNARATPGVEWVDGERYRRTIAIEGKTGALDVSHLPGRSALSVEVRFPDPQALLAILERVRRMFDLGADPAVIGEHLRGDPLLGPPLLTHPGIRTPGAWDGFELAVRAILGQQITVRAATTLAGRIAVRFGSPLPVRLAPLAQSEAEAGVLARLFPTPAQLANADLERAGVMPARAAAIRGLAAHVVNGAIAFNTFGNDGQTLAALRALPGIGDWTAAYIAMRAFGDPDAFPSGDLILRRAAGGCTARALERTSTAWRPWRAYAVMLLWQDATDHEGIRRQARKGPRDQAPEKGRSLRSGTAPGHLGEEHDQSNGGGKLDAGNCRRAARGIADGSA